MMRIVGMRLSRLTAEVLEDIARIYREVTGCKGEDLPERWDGYVNVSNIKFARSSLRNDRTVQWRLGSRISNHSKLCIYRAVGNPKIINFSLDPNESLDPYNDPIEGPMCQEFNTRIEQYLIEKDLAEVFEN